MTGRHRTIVAALALLAILSVLLLVVYAGNACPAQTPNNPCPQAGFNRIVVVGLAALAVTLTVTPFAFLGEFVVRRRIAYRGGWFRAVRRGVLPSFSLNPEDVGLRGGHDRNDHEERDKDQQ